MARTRRLTADERLIKVNEDINRLTEELKTLKEEKAVLEEQIKMDRLDQLYETIKDSGKSFEEVLELIGK